MLSPLTEALIGLRKKLDDHDEKMNARKSAPIVASAHEFGKTSLEKDSYFRLSRTQTDHFPKHTSVCSNAFFLSLFPKV